jgi:catechol 2,3-dioxygenase-like lactoylglutathione lyase family enzyme
LTAECEMPRSGEAELANGVGLTKAAPQCKLHSVAIQTAVFDRAFAFYTEVLGLRVVREPFRYKTRTLAWLDGGAALIELYSTKDGVDPDAYSNRAVGPDHVAFEVEDLDAFEVVLKEHNYAIQKGPMIPPSGDPNQPRILFAVGPDGDSVQFREPAGRRI